MAAVLGLEAKLAGKQQETSNLQLINQRLFARFQSLREQLAHSQDQLTHKQLRGTAKYCAGLLQLSYRDADALARAGRGHLSAASLSLPLTAVNIY